MMVPLMTSFTLGFAYCSGMIECDFQALSHHGGQARESDCDGSRQLGDYPMEPTNGTSWRPEMFTLPFGLLAQPS